MRTSRFEMFPRLSCVVETVVTVVFVGVGVGVDGAGSACWGISANATAYDGIWASAAPSRHSAASTMRLSIPPVLHREGSVWARLIIGLLSFCLWAGCPC